MLLVGLHPSSKSPNFMQVTQVGFYGCLLIYHRGRNIRFRNPVTFIAVRSKLDIFQGDTLPHFSRFFATNTALRNGPGEEHRSLTIFWQNQKKKKCRCTQGPWRTISINIGIIFLINL